jgi:hypothetical protein
MLGPASALGLSPTADMQSGMRCVRLLWRLMRLPKARWEAEEEEDGRKAAVGSRRSAAAAVVTRRAVVVRMVVGVSVVVVTIGWLLLLLGGLVRPWLPAPPAAGPAG